MCITLLLMWVLVLVCCSWIRNKEMLISFYNWFTWRKLQCGYSSRREYTHRTKRSFIGRPVCRTILMRLSQLFRPPIGFIIKASLKHRAAFVVKETHPSSVWCAQTRENKVTGSFDIIFLAVSVNTYYFLVTELLIWQWFHLEELVTAPINSCFSYCQLMY